MTWRLYNGLAGITTERSGQTQPLGGQVSCSICSKWQLVRGQATNVVAVAALQASNTRFVMVGCLTRKDATMAWGIFVLNMLRFVNISL